MYRLEREDFLRGPFLFLWATLAFQAGFINTFGFLACGRFVSHVTGFGTQIGMAFAEHRVLFAFELLGFPFFFIAGSFTSAMFTAARIERLKRPHYQWITMAMPAILFVLLACGRAGVFGAFGEELLRFHDFVLLFLLAFFCGMQNGCFATLTKGQIRTTHLTGVSTDIGTDAARLLFGRLNSKEKELTKRTQVSRILTFLGFASGAILSVIYTETVGYGALAVPLTTSVFTYVMAQRTVRILDAKENVAPAFPGRARAEAKATNPQPAPPAPGPLEPQPEVAANALRPGPGDSGQLYGENRAP